MYLADTLVRGTDPRTNSASSLTTVVRIGVGRMVTHRTYRCPGSPEGYNVARELRFLCARLTRTAGVTSSR
jgi:hypothetical protein